MNSSVNVSFYVLTLVFAVPTFFTGFVVQSHVQWAAGAVATFVACLNLMLLFLRYCTMQLPPRISLLYERVVEGAPLLVGQGAEMCSIAERVRVQVGRQRAHVEAAFTAQDGHVRHLCGDVH